MRRLFVLLFTSILVLSGLTAANATGKVDVCHRTASNTNPYVKINIPADEANGHITGTSSQHNQQVTWDSAGTYDGIPHAAGSPRLDYFADQGISGDCSDGQVTPPPSSAGRPDRLQR